MFKYNEIATTVTNANRGTSRTKLYKELGAGSINFLRTFYKKTEGAPKYLYKLIPIKNNGYDARSTHSVGTYCCRTNAFKYSFYFYTIREWNKLDLQLRNAESFKKSKITLLKLGGPAPDLIYRIHHPLGLKFQTRLRLGLNHFNEYRFKHYFEKCINPLGTCCPKVESIKNFLLHSYC